MSDIIYLEAYRAAIFDGSREEPKWSRQKIEECRLKQAHPVVRERIDEIATRARLAADERSRSVLRKAYELGLKPGPAA